MTTPFEETAIARRYEPIRELGSGGMGTVYLVADRFRGGEQVALKTIHPERLRHLDKFRQEFTVLSKLRHPHLLRVIDFGSTPISLPDGPIGWGYLLLDNAEQLAPEACLGGACVFTDRQAGWVRRAAAALEAEDLAAARRALLQVREEAGRG